ncbi:endolytic transglycosylase MltG [Gemmatimonas aurantiaca]|uniref:endolytic transglycosylase MltG n=1 Tax=Gemmatimonas aurantiaca TaxID=173480 RepID=UPI00301C002E
MARRRSNHRFRRVGILLVAIVAGGLLWREVSGSPSASETPARVVIPRGASMRAAADSLAAHAVVGSSRLFRWFAALTGSERAIKPGTYQFAARTGYAAVLDALVNGRGLMHTIVIPEGFDLRDITPLLVKTLGVSADSIQAATTDTAWLHRLDIPTPSLEGYLFPATYSFPDGITAREAITAMLQQFEAQWKPEWTERARAMTLSRHDVMTMASIVEKEARKAEERPLIAAVYWNRVRKGMRLQADPTVQYALPQHVERVLYKDLEVDSKYNTYKYAGLPPGPIASPGAAAIAATLAPADVPYLYFVARPDGSHEFRTTFDEHTRAIAQIRAARRAAERSQGRSSP